MRKLLKALLGLNAATDQTDRCSMDDLLAKTANTRNRIRRRQPTRMCVDDPRMPGLQYEVFSANFGAGKAAEAIANAMSGAHGPAPLDEDRFRNELGDHLLFTLISTLNALDEVRIAIPDSLEAKLNAINKTLDEASPFMDTDPPDSSAFPPRRGQRPFG